MTPPLLEVCLSAGYREQTVLKEIQFELRAGERIALLGSSGAGKSTLLLALLGLIPHRGGWATGEVLLNGRNLLTMPAREARELRGREIALVPQSPLSALNPALSLFKHFEAAWKAHRKAQRQLLLSRIEEVSRRVGLPCDPEFLNRKPGQVSVGQAQRCVLALALLHRPALIIADEPTSALDPVTQADVLQLLREICEENGTGLLFVSHDLLSVFRLCTDILMLSQGELAQRVPLECVTQTAHPDLRALLNALPVPADLLLRASAQQVDRAPVDHAKDRVLVPS